MEQALEEFGRVDCLINNAFGIPPMDPLTTLDLQGLRDANETNVFAPLRLTALFADALAASKGSVIMLNSCVLYSSQPEYAGYKLSKGALAHLASSLATELGPRGIRVNSVAPSYIYEDVNKAYFDWLASEPGVTHEDIYGEKADPTDLKRLATPDEVARAALFLASDLASAVTGQMLNVDCGEFHEPMTHPQGPRRVVRRHRGRRRPHHRAGRLRRHRPRGGAADPRRRPRLPRGRADRRRQLLPAREVKSALVGRLLTQLRFTEHPAHAEVPVERPIFVVGLPRTGTTALHRLLNADPRHQGLELWLTEFPQPRPPRETWEDDPIFSAMQAAFAEHHVENPEFMGIHYMDATSVEECWRLLRQTGKSISYESLANVPRYSAWLAEQDWTDAYARHRANLQLIGLNDPDKRWVLKNPSHLVALDALMAVYPDALVVCTHRDPVTSVASACSLSAEATAGHVDDVRRRDHRPHPARHAVPLLARLHRQPAGVRPLPVRRRRVPGLRRRPGRHHPRDLRGVRPGLDPRGGRRRRGDRPGVTQGGRRPAHPYDLADYGLTEAEVRAAF